MKIRYSVQHRRQLCVEPYGDLPVVENHDWCQQKFDEVFTAKISRRDQVVQTSWL